MCDRTKFLQNRPDGFGDIAIFRFSRGRRMPSWILKFWNFWLTIILGSLIYIVIPNFTKIGQTVAEISHLTIFKMAAIRNLGFLKVWFFDQLVTSEGCAFVQNFIKIDQTVSEISRFFDFQDGHLLDFEIFQFLVFYQFRRAKMRHRTKFHQNRSNGWSDIAFSLTFFSKWWPSAILNFLKLIFWTFLRVRRANDLTFTFSSGQMMPRLGHMRIPKAPKGVLNLPEDCANLIKFKNLTLPNSRAVRGCIPMTRCRIEAYAGHWPKKCSAVSSSSLQSRSDRTFFNATNFRCLQSDMPCY